VVLSRDGALRALGRAIVAPCTTNIRGLPTEVTLEPGEDPVPETCVINLDSLENVSLSLLVDHIGQLSQTRLHEVCDALEVAVDCIR